MTIWTLRGLSHGNTVLPDHYGSSDTDRTDCGY